MTITEEEVRGRNATPARHGIGFASNDLTRLGKGPAVVLADGAMAYRVYFGGRPLAAGFQKSC